MADDPFWCKWCKTTFTVSVPKDYTGDALVICPECGWKHPRQFAGGVAISCDPPRADHIVLERKLNQ